MNLLIMLVGLVLTVAIGGYGSWLIISSVTAHWNQLRCSDCGYDLRARSQDATRCPECGHNQRQGTYIERRPWRAFLGLGLIAVAGAAFFLAFMLAIR